MDHIAIASGAFVLRSRRDFCLSEATSCASHQPSGPIEPAGFEALSVMCKARASLISGSQEPGRDLFTTSLVGSIG